MRSAEKSYDLIMGAYTPKHVVTGSASERVQF